jgi:hypothetical protein
VVIDREAFDEWLAASVQSQGIDLLVQDPFVLDQVATLLGRSERDAQRKRALHASSAPVRTDQSGAPDHVDAA